MTELVSEPITPLAGSIQPAPQAGLPGLPAAFTWRGAERSVMRVLETWKHSSREGGHAGGELYLRRHYFRLLMNDGSVWTVYFLRQRLSSGNARQRWFLYTIEQVSLKPAIAPDRGRSRRRPVGSVTC